MALEVVEEEVEEQVEEQEQASFLLLGQRASPSRHAQPQEAAWG